ncbi:MAG: hypothetical protein V7629_20450 [Motiliproteus sp.]
MNEIHWFLLGGIIVTAVVLTELFADGFPSRQYCTRSRLYRKNGVARWCCGKCKE